MTTGVWSIFWRAVFLLTLTSFSPLPLTCQLLFAVHFLTCFQRYWEEADKISRHVSLRTKGAYPCWGVNSCFSTRSVLLYCLCVEERSLTRFVLWPQMYIFSFSLELLNQSVIYLSVFFKFGVLLVCDYSSSGQSFKCGLFWVWVCHCVHTFSLSDFVNFVCVCLCVCAVFWAPVKSKHTLTFTCSCHNWLIPIERDFSKVVQVQVCSPARKKGLHFTEQTELFQSSLI